MTQRRGVSYHPILVVLFYEYLAISLTRSLLPEMIVEFFGDWAYHLVGAVEAIRGILAFFACPMFGKLSDRIGRRTCLFATVLGTTMPVLALTFTRNLWVFGILQALSGIFAATFPVAFAYIADFVEPKERAPAYGMALATFGLSFTMGPITGGYLAKSFGPQAVFRSSFVLVCINLLYMIFLMPESNPETIRKLDMRNPIRSALEDLPLSWRPSEILAVFTTSDFLNRIGKIVFLYYLSVYAIISTLMVFVTKALDFTPVMTGYLLSAFGLSTMFAEGVVVRLAVPRFGETLVMQVGLAAFALQCVCLAFANGPGVIFGSMGFSMLGNLVYPSISSLVSKAVSKDEQGEALGALNGLKALTEGIGPLVFGILMHTCEDSAMPGAPYLLAAVFAAWSFVQSYALPSEDELATGKVIATERQEEEGIPVMEGPDWEPYTYGSIYAAQSLLGAASDDEGAGDQADSARTELLEMSGRRNASSKV